MNRAVRFVFAVALAAVAGCAGPPPDLMVPKAADANFGYVEKRISDSTYEITYYGPEVYTEVTVKSWLERIAATAQKTSHDLALWRAAQLATDKGYKGFTVTADKGTVRHYIVGRDYENVPVSTFQDVTIRKLEYWSGTYFRGEAALTVDLTDDLGHGAFDAAKTLAAMQSRYPAAVTQAIMADTRYYFGPPSWLYGYEEGYTEAPVFESTKEAPKAPPKKPLGQPYYSP